MGWFGKTLIFLAGGGILLAAAPYRAAGSPPPSPRAPSKPARETIGDNTVLCEVNGEKIRVRQLRERMRWTEYRHARAMQGEKEARETALRDLILDRLVLQQMRSSGKTKTGEFLGPVGAAGTIALGNRFLRAMQKEAVPEGEQVRKRLPNFFRELDLRYFFAATFREAAEVREKVVAGADFEAIVRERSVGPGAEKGGLVRGYRPSGGKLPEPIEQEAFTSGTGWVSPVFETSIGYCVVRVEDARDMAPDQIADAAREALGDARSEAGVQAIRQAEISAGATLDNAALLGLDALPHTRWKERFDDGIATVGGEKVTVGDLYWYIYAGRKKRFPKPGAGEVVPLAKELTRYLAAAREARERGFDRSPEYQDWLRQYSDQVLLEMFRDETANSVRVSDKEAREFFDRNRNALKRPAGREIREVAVKDPETARTLYNQFKERPGDLDRFAATPEDPGEGAKTKVLYRGEISPEAEKVVFGAPVGTLSGPHDFGGIWVVFIVDREVPPVEKPVFDGYRELAREGARQEKIANAIRERKEQLYRKAGIQSYPNVLEAVEW